jgi:hypothetical protein
MAATVAPSHAGGLPSSSGISAPSHSATSHSHSQDVSGTSTPSTPSSLPQTRKLNLRDFRRVRTLGTGMSMSHIPNAIYSVADSFDKEPLPESVLSVPPQLRTSPSITNLTPKSTPSRSSENQKLFVSNRSIMSATNVLSLPTLLATPSSPI